MRTNQTIQQHEVDAYAKFCVEHNIIHDGTDGDIANANLVLEYFTKTWNEDITAANLEKAFPQLKPHLKFDSPARKEVQRLFGEYADANALASWFEKQALLKIEGDDGFRNFSEIVLELQGRPATQANIDSAIMSIQHATEGGGSVGKFSTRRRRPLVYAHQSSRPLSEAAKKDSQPFLGTDLVKNSDGSFRSKTPQEQKRDMEENSKNTSSSPQPTGPVDVWENLCNELFRFGTHSAQANMRELFDRGIRQGKSYRQIYTEMNALKASYRRLISTAKY